ncbi:unnamed protein product [Rotaria socialis]|uniref:adenosine kinase n=1 Tax=Rotaria socialis TaxID=392032 RepID=A0A821GHY4_9BILA|nr:unnamed protein product [Rotaria socialis]
MSSAHKSTASALTVCIPRSKCSCSQAKEITHVCLGCYEGFCSKCYKEHRRQISSVVECDINANDMIVQAIHSSVLEYGGDRGFNPVKLRDQINAFHDNMILAVNDSTRQALCSLRKLIDERNDILIDLVEPITELGSMEDVKSYVERNQQRIVAELRARNDRIEQTSSSSVRVSVHCAPATDWDHLIELEQSEQNGKWGVVGPVSIDDLHFERLIQGHEPIKRIDNQKIGRAIAASDRHVIFVRNNDELSIVECNRDYQTIIPMPRGKNVSDALVEVLDICWLSSQSVFILLSEAQIFKFDPSSKTPRLVSEIRPPGGRLFASCTSSRNTLLLSFTGEGSCLQEWSPSDWTLRNQWNAPISCRKDQKIRSIRFSQSGSRLGVTLSNDRKSDYFEVRDANTMQCVWSKRIPAMPCLGPISLPNDKWHNLKEGQILLAGNEHQQIFEDIDGKARLASGGSSQNIMRSIAVCKIRALRDHWFLQQPRVATYMGCVGTDFDSTRLQEVAQEAGLNTLYQEHPTLPTGRCAILVMPDSQTRIASLGASEAFTSIFLEVEENWQHIARARVLCSEGFFLVSNREAFMRICEYSHKKRKIFAMTLSAKYICDDPYGSRLLSALPYADIVFGIEDDAKVFARSQLDIESTNLHTIIKAIRNAPKWNMNRPRIVVLSKLKVRTTVATVENVKEYEWKRQANVVDTHGCADAFAGGFLAYRALDKNVDECVRAGLYCAYENLKQLGCLFPSKVSFSPHKSLDDDDD